MVSGNDKDSLRDSQAVLRALLTFMTELQVSCISSAGRFAPAAGSLPGAPRAERADCGAGPGRGACATALPARMGLFHHPCCQQRRPLATRG